jgi:hypothetical protein
MDSLFFRTLEFRGNGGSKTSMNEVIEIFRKNRMLPNGTTETPSLTYDFYGISLSLHSLMFLNPHSP